MKRLFFAGIAALAIVDCLAAEAFAPSDSELSMLPAFCARKLKGQETPAEGARYPHMHHYCFGLNFVNRALRSRDPSDRRFNLSSAKGEFGYVIKHTPPDYWMRPQIYVDVGRVHRQLKETVEALGMFSQAIAMNPAFLPAYAELITTYRMNGDRKSALETATSGLRYLPDAKSLQDAYLEFGGRKPFPEPVRRSPVTETPVGEAAQGDSEKVPAHKYQAPANRDDVSSTSESELGRVDANDPPEKGCRFCPPEEIQKKWRDSFGTPSGK